MLKVSDFYFMIIFSNFGPQMITNTWPRSSLLIMKFDSWKKNYSDSKFKVKKGRSWFEYCRIKVSFLLWKVGGFENFRSWEENKGEVKRGEKKIGCIISSLAMDSPYRAWTPDLITSTWTRLTRRFRVKIKCCFLENLKWIWKDILKYCRCLTQIHPWFSKVCSQFQFWQFLLLQWIEKNSWSLPGLRRHKPCPRLSSRYYCMCFIVYSCRHTRYERVPVLYNCCSLCLVNLLLITNYLFLVFCCIQIFT